MTGKENSKLLYDESICTFTKGQIISKGLFGVLEFSQKTNEWIHCISKNNFVCLFFGRIRGYKKSLRNYLTFKDIEDYFRKKVLFPLWINIGGSAVPPLSSWPLGLPVLIFKNQKSQNPEDYFEENSLGYWKSRNQFGLKFKVGHSNYVSTLPLFLNVTEKND